MILPGVEIALDFGHLFLKTKVTIEGSQELFEQKFVVDAILNFCGYLLENLDVFIHQEGLVLVMLPLVLEVVLYICSQRQIHRFVVIEAVYDSEESRDFVIIVET